MTNKEHALTINTLPAETDLTVSQKEALKKIAEFLASDKKVFILKGYAGTGKTFLIGVLCRILNANNRAFNLMAPTGRASRVLKSKTGFNAYTIHKTIYSFNELIEYKSEDNNDDTIFKYFFRIRINDDNADCLYIVDEASMLSDVYSEEEYFRFGSGYLLKDFFDYVNIFSPSLRRKVIFVGDDAQLPPANTNFSFALSQSFLSEAYSLESDSIELSDIVRHKADSRIIAEAAKLREAISTASFRQFKIDQDERDIIRLLPEETVKLFLDRFRLKKSAAIIAWTNKQVYDYNNSVREKLFPGTRELTKGDRILVVANSYNKAIELLNGDIGYVKEVSPVVEVRNVAVFHNKERIVVELRFRNVELIFLNQKGERVTVNSKIIENLLYSDQPSLSVFEVKALYIDFKIRKPELKPGTQEFKDTLKTDPYFNALKIKFGYALTCHKAQGGEWDEVIADLYTQKGVLNSSYFRWCYTAITRAQDKLYILNVPEAESRFEVIEGTEEYGLLSAISDHQDDPLLEKFSSSQETPREIYKLARSILHGTNFIITAIDHYDWQERYLISDGTNGYCFNIFYNSKGKITSINYLSARSNVITYDLSGKVNFLLSEMLKRKIIKVPPSEVNIEEKKFEGEAKFLYPILSNLKIELSKMGIFIGGIELKQYRVRLVLFRGAEVAVSDLIYNSKNFVTKIQQLPGESNSPDLMSIVQKTLLEVL